MPATPYRVTLTEGDVAVKEDGTLKIDTAQVSALTLALTLALALALALGTSLAIAIRGRFKLIFSF